MKKTGQLLQVTLNNRRSHVHLSDRYVMETRGSLSKAKIYAKNKGRKVWELDGWKVRNSFQHEEFGTYCGYLIGENVDYETISDKNIFIEAANLKCIFRTNIR